MSRANKRITLDLSGIEGGEGSLLPEPAGLTERLEQARQAVLTPDSAVSAADAGSWSGVESLPTRILDDYVQHREQSQLGRILQTARRLQDAVDRVILLGDARWMRGARVWKSACCEPYFDQLTRAQRGGRLRLIFADHLWDNDAVAGLLELLVQGRSADRLEDRWALLTLPEESGGHAGTPRGGAPFFRALSRFYGRSAWPTYYVRLVRSGGPVPWLATLPAGAAEHAVGPQVAGEFSVFSPAGLLPAACLGLDVVRLLEGAAEMSDRFHSATRGDNPVVDYAAVARRMEQVPGAGRRVVRLGAVSLEALGCWYASLLGRFEHLPAAATIPRSVVATRDPLPPVRPDRPGGCDLWLTDVTVDRVRCDPCRGEWSHEISGDSAPKAKTLPELAASRLDETLRPYRRDGVPVVRIGLPQINEGTLGQLLQMLMLATVVENVTRVIPVRSSV